MNGDGTASPTGILAMIDSLNGAVPLPDYSVDVDRSAVPRPSDILRVIDLLNGAMEYAPWFGEVLPAALGAP